MSMLIIKGEIAYGWLVSQSSYVSMLIIKGEIVKSSYVSIIPYQI